MPPLADRARRVFAGVDARLLLAAAAGWVAVLACLALPAPMILALAAVAALVAVMSLALSRRGPVHERGGGRFDRVELEESVESVDDDGSVSSTGLGCYGSRRWATLALSACAVAVTLIAAGAQSMVRQAGPVDTLAAQQAVVRVEAIVQSDPRPVAAGRGPGEVLVITRVLIRSVTGRGEHSTPRTPVLVLGDRRWLGVHWHERVAFTGRLQPAQSGDDVEAVLSARGAVRVVSGAGPVLAAVEALRADLRTATRPLPADPRGLVPALVIGDTTQLPAQLNDDMRATGMTHLNAVSGSNALNTVFEFPDSLCECPMGCGFTRPELHAE